MAMANFWFWAGTPESWVTGSVSILLAVASVNTRLLRTVAGTIFVSAFSLGTTVTNWPAALIVHFRTLRPWPAILTTFLSAVIVVLLSLALQPFVRAHGYRILANAADESKYVDERRPVARMIALVVNPAVAPAFVIASRDQWSALSFENSRPGSRGALSLVCIAGWLTLLAIGTSDLVIRAVCGFQLEQVLGAILVSQLGLYAMYGDETFLYSMHFAPLLALVVGLHLPRATGFFRIVLALTVVGLCLSNLGALREGVQRTAVEAARVAAR
jgi:hypothetical protein